MWASRPAPVFSDWAVRLARAVIRASVVVEEWQAMESTEFDQYDALVHAIYDAALEPRLWPSVLSGIARASESSKGLLYTPLHTPAEGGFLFPHEFPESSLALWAIKGVRDDPLVKEAAARGIIARGEGVAIDGEELMPLPALMATDFYRELWEPFDIGRVCSGMVFDSTDARKVPTILGVYRSLREPPFEHRHVNLLERLLAHVSRSLGVMFHLRDSQLRAAASIAALERLTAGVFLLGSDLGLQFMNGAGRRLVADNGPLCIRGSGGSSDRLELPGRLRAMQKDFDVMLAGAAIPLSARQPAHFSQAMVLPDHDGRPVCVLHAAPLGDAPSLAIANDLPRAIVIAYDVALASTVKPGQLVELFELTPAEARAAVEIMRGGTVADMAARLGVTVNTFKTQLKAVYGKTGSNRQTDFLKLLLALARPE